MPFTTLVRPQVQACIVIFGSHGTDVCAAFAATFLIRIARLFPHELNLKKTARDVEELASVLSESEFPAMSLIQQPVRS